MRLWFAASALVLLGGCGSVPAGPDSGAPTAGGLATGGGGAGGGAGGGTAETDAGLSCDTVAAVLCADDCSQFMFGEGRASTQTVQVPLLIKGPAECLDVSVTGPGGPSTGQLVARTNGLGEWAVEFVANVAGSWNIVVSRKGRPDVKATFVWNARPSPAVLVAPCLRLPRSCQRLFSTGGLVACDEAVYTLDGGVVGALPDGGFFLGGLRFAAVGGLIHSVMAPQGGVTLGAGIPFPAPTAWAVEGQSVLVATATEGRIVHLHDDGGLEATMATPPAANPTAFFLGEDHPVLGASGQRLCDVFGVCAPRDNSPFLAPFTPSLFHAADGRGVEYTYQTIMGRRAARVEFTDGGFVGLAPPSVGMAFTGWLPQRGLFQENEGFALDHTLQRVFAVQGALRFGASVDATWATTATESLIFCE